MNVTIEINIDDELADPDHDTGLSEQTYDEVMQALMPLGSDIEIRRAEP